jgi:uncharacterized small protein (DUF1192 family)
VIVMSAMMLATPAFVNSSIAQVTAPGTPPPGPAPKKTPAERAQVEITRLEGALTHLTANRDAMNKRIADLQARIAALKAVK